MVRPASKLTAFPIGITTLFLSSLLFNTGLGAQTGTLLKTVNLPAAAQCTSGIGTSVAIVPGSLLGLNQYPILLATSCYSGAQISSIYLLDPSTNPATLVRTITTAPTPPLGWGSLALRGNKGDILGCGNNSSGTHAIYSINVFTGAATFLFNGAPGLDICDGVTWDTGNRTIYQSPDVSSTIYHFDQAGASLGTFASPAGCPNSGLAVGGASLFAACDGNLDIYQVNKTTGAVFTHFVTAGQRTEDLECDNVSFAALGKDAMWSKDAYTNQLFAFEIPAGTCGFAGGPPVVPAACPDGSKTDTDGDGLLDCWENNGIDFDGDGVIDYHIPGADPMHKDI